jgi:uncharacterized membrane protein
MPERSPDTPLEAMTWGRALPVLALCLLFDALRFMCEQLWFFGPAIASIYCTAKVSGSVGTSLAGLLCGTGGIAAGYFGAPLIVPLGVVLAMAVGLFGWLVIGAWLTFANKRIFKENSLWFAGSLLLSETPLIGALPALTGIVGKMYRTQIQKEAAELAAYKKRREEATLAERRMKTAQFIQNQQAVAADDAPYTQAA